MLKMTNYTKKPIELARKDLIGIKITDVFTNAIFLESETGNKFTISSGNNQLCVTSFLSTDEEVSNLRDIVSILLDKLGIDDEQLIKYINGDTE